MIRRGVETSKTILITDEGTGLGALSARAPARAGHTVYAGLRDAMDAPPVSYAGELPCSCIETTIIVPDPSTSGTGHRAPSGRPADSATARAYEEEYGGMTEEVGGRIAALTPAGADASRVADAVVQVVDAPHGSRPFRVHVDPVDGGSEEVSAVADRVREHFLPRIGIEDVLRPH